MCDQIVEDLNRRLHDRKESKMDESTMKHLLASAQDKLRQQGELLQRLTETPLVYATVIATGTETK